ISLFIINEYRQENQREAYSPPLPSSVSSVAFLDHPPCGFPSFLFVLVFCVTDHFGQCTRKSGHNPLPYSFGKRLVLPFLSLLSLLLLQLFEDFMSFLHSQGSFGLPNLFLLNDLPQFLEILLPHKNGFAY